MLPEAFKQKQLLKERSHVRSQELLRELEQLPLEEREVRKGLLARLVMQELCFCNRLSLSSLPSIYL